jgi:glycosyltransferase involved in cell wall biosynthesis
MPRAPLVSVVVAVHNGSQLVGECIASVLRQSHDALELLVVDDGSTDDTVRVVGEWSRRDARVKLLRIEHAGQALALNAGIAAAQGAYIARIDHDDLWHRERLKQQIAWLDRDGLDVGGAWVRKFGDEQGVMRFPLGHEAIRWEALFTCPILDSASLFRGDVLRQHPYPPSAVVRTEMVQLLRLLPRYRFGNLPRVLARYRFHVGQKTRRLAALARYRQRQLQEQHFAEICPEAGARERATFAVAIGDGPLRREELLPVADLFLHRLAPADPEARWRLLQQWRRLVVERAEPDVAAILRHHLDGAFLTR